MKKLCEILRPAHRLLTVGFSPGKPRDGSALGTENPFKNPNWQSRTGRELSVQLPQHLVTDSYWTEGKRAWCDSWQTGAKWRFPSHLDFDRTFIATTMERCYPSSSQKHPSFLWTGGGVYTCNKLQFTSLPLIAGKLWSGCTRLTKDCLTQRPVRIQSWQRYYWYDSSGG